MKKCTLCSKKKPLTDFNSNKKYKDGFYNHCKSCHYEVYGRDKHYKRTYGISQKEYNEKIKELNECCEVCGSMPSTNRSSKWNRLVVDHNHTTGEIRGFLCQPCNMALGSAKDNPKILRALANYLDERGHE